jgi:hypothetical protein
MTLETIGAALGAGIAAAGVVITGAKRWLTRPAEKKLDAMSVELGVGIGPTIASLVMSTAGAVQRLEDASGVCAAGIKEILRIQESHGVKLDMHEQRFEIIEQKHDELHERVGQIVYAFNDSTDPSCPLKISPAVDNRRSAPRDRAAETKPSPRKSRR